MSTTPITHIAKSLSVAIALLCFTILFQMTAHADTLTIIGSSNSQNPLLSSSGQVGFIGQSFNNSFTVTSIGQTFTFVFGQNRIAPGSGIIGDSGCSDGPCIPLTLTGSLTTPIGALSFGGLFEEADGVGRTLAIDWLTGSGPFTVATPEGGVVVFSMELVDFVGFNQGASPLFLNQMARVTITGFQAGGQTAVPEPATMLLLGTGVAGLLAARRRRTRS